MNRMIPVGVIAVLSLGAFAWPARAQRATTASSASSALDAQPLKPQGFSVVLVLGDLQGGTTQDNVPPAARKALTDMKEFLPYKSYRLLDVQWTLCCGGGRGATPVVSRLRGPDGHDYELTLAASLEQNPHARLGVRFALRDPSGEDGEASDSELIRELQSEKRRLEMEYETLRHGAEKRFQVGTGKPPDEEPEVRQARLRVANATIKLAEAKQHKPRSGGPKEGPLDRRARPMIDTSFTMDVGETVVVGTSRLAGGDKALIALLTAVARNPSTK